MQSDDDIRSLEGHEYEGFPGLVVQPNVGAPPNYPMELYRLYFASSADVPITLEGHDVLLKHGQLLTLSPGETVEFDDNASLLSLAFHHNFFCIRVQRDEVYCDGVVFNRLSGLPIVAFPESEGPIVRAKLQELASILEHKRQFSRDRAVNALRSLLLHAADFKQLDPVAVRTLDEGTAKLSELVLAFQHLVEETYDDHKDASFYSESLGVTLTTLNRRVKAELGQSVMQVVNERLAIAARVALRSGKRSIKDVALDLGFTDPLYFSRFFRKHFGMPPSRYFAEPVTDLS